jgi:glucokinase
MAFAVGIDVGGTNIRFGVFDGKNLVDLTRLEANIGAVCRALTFETAPAEVIRVLSTEIQALIKKHTQIQAIGLGFPGFIEPVSKKIMQSPNLPHLKDFDLRALLSQAIHLPVTLENDANVAAYGEFCLLDSAPESLMYIGLGTGVGGGLILNRKLYAGINGVAMEVGHIVVTPHGRQCGCGNLGCMETYASATGVSSSYFELSNQHKTAAEIAALAETGDQHAAFAYQQAARSLAQALASVLKVIDVQDVVIGGGMSHAWHLMEKSFNDQLDHDLIPVLRNKIQVKISTANDTAGMLGAAMLALS